MELLLDKYYNFSLILKKTKSVDTEPPVINDCPANFEVVIELGESSTTVTWTEPTATDTSGFAMLMQRSNMPGDVFFLGNNQVTYTFVDNSNNVAFCSFSIFITPSKYTQ